MKKSFDYKHEKLSKLFYKFITVLTNCEFDTFSLEKY